MNVGIMAENSHSPNTVNIDDLDDVLENCWMYCGVPLKPADNMAEAEMS